MITDQFINMHLNLGDLYLLRDVKGKCVDHKSLRRLFPDAPRPEIEEGVFTELPDSRPMAAFHIVCENFQLGLGIDRGFITDNKIIILLERIRLLRVLVYKYLTIEYTRGLLQQYALVQLIALTKRLLMVDQRMVIDQLLTRRQVKTIQMALRMRFFQPGIQIVPDQFRAGQGKSEIIIQALFPLPDRRMLHETNTGARGLDHRMTQPGIGMDDDLRKTIDPDLSLTTRHNRFDHGDLRIPVDHPYMTGLDQKILRGSISMDKMKRPVSYNTRIDTQK